ncbi:MAG: BON domain-containing protein [Acidobacteriota bacterium]
MKLGTTFASMFTAAALLAVPGFAGSAKTPEPVKNANLESDIRHAINTLAYYDVFDDLSFRIADDGTVTLLGEVTRYNVRNNAGSAVKHIAGVTKVDNQIEVLPLSYFDDNIRIRAYNAIFGFPALSRYSLNSRSPIRIIVKNGNITLAGVVNSELDRRLVEMRIRALPNTFSVTNHLRLDSEVAVD